MNALTEILPPRLRSGLYLLLAVAGVVTTSLAGVMLADGGSVPRWLAYTTAVVTGLTGLFGLTAAANTPTPEPVVGTLPQFDPDPGPWIEPSGQPDTASVDLPSDQPPADTDYSSDTDAVYGRRDG